MLKRLLSLSRYPALLVLFLAGIFAVGLAFVAANLFQVATANLNFLREYGWVAVREGALVQLFWIAVNGAVALFFYFGFKFCEADLTRRYMMWIRQ